MQDITGIFRATFHLFASFFPVLIPQKWPIFANPFILFVSISSHLVVFYKSADFPQEPKTSTTRLFYQA